MRPFTTRAMQWIVALAALLIAMSIPGDRVSAQDPANSSTKEEERQKLDEMKEIVQAFQVAVIDEQDKRTPASMTPEPLHRWTDPTRPFSGGALWAWKCSGRPVAIIAIELYGAWSLEFVSLSTGRVRADDGGMHWAPVKAGVEFHDVPDAPAPAADEAGRLRQMRELARKLTATEFWEGRDHALRLLPHPIDRYSDPASGLADGALFIYANGTNPEVLLMVEARRQGNGPPKWKYAAAALSNSEMHLKHVSRDVWTVPDKGPAGTRPDEPYHIELTPRRSSRP